jgi:hypothetical protein
VAEPRKANSLQTCASAEVHAGSSDSPGLLSRRARWTWLILARSLSTPTVRFWPRIVGGAGRCFAWTEWARLPPFRRLQSRTAVRRLGAQPMRETKTRVALRAGQPANDKDRGMARALRYHQNFSDYLAAKIQARCGVVLEGCLGSSLLSRFVPARAALGGHTGSSLIGNRQVYPALPATNHLAAHVVRHVQDGFASQVGAQYRNAHGLHSPRSRFRRPPRSLVKLVRIERPLP